MGKTTFPLISFFDGYVNFRIQPYDWGDPFNTANLSLRAKELSTMMDTLGITHSVSWADQTSTTPSDYNNKRKILDMHLGWSKDTPEILGVETGTYLNAQGQDKNSYPFQVGKSSSFSLAEGSNFGFGNNQGSSVWFMNTHTNLVPSWVVNKITGVDTTIEVSSGTYDVRKAVPSSKEDIVKFYMLYGKIGRILFTNANEQHYISLRGMIGPSTLPDTTVILRVQLKIVPASGAQESGGVFNPQLNSHGPSKSNNMESVPARSFEMVVRKGDLSSTNMGWVTLTDTAFHFRDYSNDIAGKVIEVGIRYENKVTTYIDAVSINDQLYQEFFNDPILRDTIKNQINAKKDIVGGNPLFETFYYDEPFMLTAQVRKSYTDFVREDMPSGKNFDLSGASGNYWRWHFRFDRKYAKNDITGFYKNSLIFNHYPFSLALKHGYETGGQTDIQAALNNLIEYRGERVLPTGPEDPEQFMGLVTAIDAAQNFTYNVLSDDIPLIHTLQVSGIREFNPVTQTYRPGPFGLRIPSRQEIEVQGNLALTFGAKGFMFYMIPTRIDPWGMATYGVFDDQNNPYNESSPNVAKARADNPQVPNSRYWALKDYIKSLKPIENWFLRTTWAGTFSGNTQSYRMNARKDWIDGVYTKIDSLGEDFGDYSYTETGMLQLTKFNDPNTIEPDTLFLYITNKLVDESALDSTASTRFVRVYLKDLGLTYNNYSVIDITDANQPIIASLSEGLIGNYRYFETKIRGGGGKLIMITPTIYTGGVFREDETISRDETINKTIHMKDHNLTVNSGADMTFKNLSKLIVEDGKLTVTGTSGNKSIFNFETVNWTANNGIFVYRQPVKMNYVEIKNANCGLYSHVSPGDTIDNTTITNTNCGISLYYSYNYGQDRTVIRNSTITNANLWGITMIGSRPRLHDNYFGSSNGKGINAITASAPKLVFSDSADGNNRFENVKYSIYSLNSQPILGKANSSEYFGNNCFTGDQLSLWAINETPGLDYEIEAYGNDWGESEPEKFHIEATGGITVLTDGFHNNCSGTWLSAGKGKDTGLSPKFMDNGDPDSLKNILLEAKQLISVGMRREAKILLTSIINGNCGVNIKKSAVSMLPESYEPESINELTTDLLTIRNITGLFNSTTMLLMNIDTDNFINYKKDIFTGSSGKMQQGTGEDEIIMTAFNLLVEEKYKASNIADSAGVIIPMLNFLNNNYPTSAYTEQANLLYSTEIPENSMSLNAPGKGGTVATTENEENLFQYKLYNNYPNPFNPETVIQYSLKEQSMVSITIHDILGRNILEKSFGEMNSGFYDWKWEGINKYGEKVSSGVYILTLDAKSLESGTHFKNTIKLVLTK